MSLQLRQRLISVEEYHKMGEYGILKESDRVELIRGQIIQMSPIGSKHAACIDKILSVLRVKLSDEREIIRIQSPIQMKEFTEPEPDITILKPAKDFYAEAHPTPKDILLIIEVADTSYSYDKKVKSELYASAGIPSYCIVNIETQEIELFHQPAEKLYKNIQIFLPGDIVEFKILGISVEVDRLLI